MTKGIIYCAISPSDKKYYGYTINFNKRKRDHKAAVILGVYNKFYNAIRKYGWENFKWDIIEFHTAETKKELRNILFEREIYWINKENTTELGYNITKGGGGFFGMEHSEKSKEKIRSKNSGKTHPNFGKRHSIETIEKNRQSNLGRKDSIETKHKKSLSLRGKKHNLKLVKCPYCKKEGKGPNMSRYHMENCKNKK